MYGLGGGGGGRWPFFLYRTRTFWRFGICSKNLVWFVYRVSPCLARCSIMSSVWQISVTIVNGADFHAESTGEGPTLQLNNMLEKFTKNCVQAYFASKCIWLA